MASTTFEQLLMKGIKTGYLPNRTQEARKWYRQQAKKILTPAPTLMKEDRSLLKNNMALGKLYMYAYQPIHRATLPYYDTFPCIFYVDRPRGKTQHSYFYGINMHYIPLPERARLMDALYTVTNNEFYDQNTKLQISYGLLKTASKFRWFKPAFKLYRRDAVKSRFLEIPSSSWDIAIWLPLAQWHKASQQEVFRDYRKKLAN